MADKGFIQIYKETLTDNYSNFDGRARRREYWGFMFINICVMIPVLAVLFIAVYFKINALMYTVFGLVILYALGTLIPNIAVTVRRLHDTNKSGWFYLFSFIPYIGSFILLVFMLIEGTKGANNYGHDPKMAVMDEISEIGQQVE